MNKNEDHFQVLRKIDKKAKTSQRALAEQLGFSLGKLNYCLRELKKKGFVPIDQVKRINKPIPTKKGGSFGDVLFLNSKLLNKKNIYFYRLKNYIINLIIFDLFVFTKKILKRYIKTILKK